MKDLIIYSSPAIAAGCLACFLYIMRKLNKLADSYATEKGKNLATKEDIEKLTALVKSVEQKYLHETETFKATLQRELEVHKGNIQFRNVALERRLDAHQKGFSLLFELMAIHANADEESVTNAANMCALFWKNNCFYLSAEVHNTYEQAIASLVNYSKYCYYAKKGQEWAINEQKKAIEDVRHGFNALKTGVQVAGEDDRSFEKQLVEMHEEAAQK
jgi:hypothetical protein